MDKREEVLNALADLIIKTAKEATVFDVPKDLAEIANTYLYYSKQECKYEENKQAE